MFCDCGNGSIYKWGILRISFACTFESLMDDGDTCIRYLFHTWWAGKELAREFLKKEKKKRKGKGKVVSLTDMDGTAREGGLGASQTDGCSAWK